MVCVIWSPAGVTALDRLERVQRKFTRLTVRRLLNDPSASLPPYPARCQLLGLYSLKDRHCNARFLLIASILLSNIDSPSLLAAIPFYVPSHQLRERPPLFIPTCRSLFAQNDPWLRALRAFNAVSALFDHNLSIASFRSRLSPPSS